MEQHRVMIEAVENHMPEVIIIDEISTQVSD
jgi:stage III sporulation protein SpoIIIAA